MKIPYAEKLGKAFVPKRVRPYLHRYLLVAGIDKKPYEFFGIMFYVASFLGIVLNFWVVDNFYQDLFMFSNLKLVLIPLMSFITTLTILLLLVAAIMLSIYFFLDLQIYNRTAQLEAVLPDFFEIVSSNLKGGLSFERSLWLAIKPRFGILAEEIGIAAKKVMTGHDIDKALNEFAEKYHSPMLKRSVGLITSELKSGGKISDIIDKLTMDLKKTKELKAEMSASVLSYIIFISAVVIFISPLLFALSVNLLSIIQRVTGLLATSMAQSSSSFIGGSSGSFTIDPKDFILFSQGALAVIAIFASMIISIIEKGNIKGGLKYIPMYLLSSQILYLIFLQIMTGIFSGMVTV